MFAHPHPHTLEDRPVIAELLYLEQCWFRCCIQNNAMLGAAAGSATGPMEYIFTGKW